MVTFAGAFVVAACADAGVTGTGVGDGVDGGIDDVVVVTLKVGFTLP